ncbi:nickel ABC transporter substrate-binding protein [Paenibacillus sp. FSL R7-0273]|uniref:staphylopine-dependent metal ABC transporter substrate-binding lipoprotein n=1 Tax=Paenibacillus sp. FSL R7-0273 TaxID=1536772 RepID=UPI0004F925AB|nr:nickel ABC transporter substrate-binding protein [Paenibacillus sp. FSL R7-0273]AIQ47369.1 nickel ABC transporter substrate-binding protein [Paenibacillus sp. FSL R7-0273]OMF96077.1 nickel ABC transporter, nickel/metallophore periplasmic binding protein [Paenibacillus sp. FSL R7-0273]
MKRKLITLLAAVTALALLAGCGKTENAQTNASSPKQELVYATVKDINDMNPHLYPGSMPAQGMVYESLVENTPEGIKPLLAESWDISADGTVYTFHLRQGVTFHDGEPFNAEAVKQNIDAVQHNAVKHSWIKLSAKITDTKVLDEYTFELKLSEPYYPAMLELSMTRPYVFLSPKDFVNGETKDGVQGYNGTGPYRLTEHQTDQYAVFEANNEYWNGAPELKKITAKVLPTGETTFLALQKGEVNFVFTDDRGTDSIDTEAMDRLIESGDYQVVRSEAMNTKMIVANSSKTDSPAHDRAVREAVWHAIDRESIASQIFNGKETPAETLFSANVNYADIGLKARAYDLQEAARLLDGAGWAASSGGTRTKDGKALSMELFYDAASLSQKTQAELIQNTVKGIGMELRLIGEDSSSIANRRAAGNYDLLFNQTWGLAYDPQSTVSAFTSESSYYHATSGIAQAEELFGKISSVMVATEEDQRKSLYRDILTIVHDEAIFIPITNGNLTVVAPSGLQGIGFKQTQFELPFEKMRFE